MLKQQQHGRGFCSDWLQSTRLLRGTRGPADLLSLTARRALPGTRVHPSPPISVWGSETVFPGLCPFGFCRSCLSSPLPHDHSSKTQRTSSGKPHLKLPSTDESFTIFYYHCSCTDLFLPLDSNSQGGGSITGSHMATWPHRIRTQLHVEWTYCLHLKLS